VGFVESLRSTSEAPATNFYDWNLQTFGEGIARHFMLPYNEKFWKQDLHGITSDWVSWAIPKPSLAEVVNGALGLTNKGMGYNPRFIYPKNGGIDCLPQSLARSIRRIRMNETVEYVDARRKVVRLKSGREEAYEYLVSTMPLPVLFGMLKDVPDSLRQAAHKLRAISVLNINIGVDRPGVSDQHWIYFPERQYIFSRVGFPMNFSDTVGPPGTSSIYVEITHHPGERPNLEEAFARSVEGLEHCGILRKGDRILTRHVLDIGHAYVVFDRHRQLHLDNLVAYLESRDIFTAGRYGRWDYFSMEDSILSGKSVSEKIVAACQPHLV
jgi:protoporphyrinogen oxidase